jgi:acetyl/propionyl-CoA carboxylase alpha subunit
MNWIEVEFQGAKYRIPALKFQGRLWFHWRGETHVLDNTGGTRVKSGEKANVRPGVILAPMPGKITKVTVQKGEAVSKGQALVVMEAMKMEYTLEADRDGQVEEVKVKAGAQVTLGEVLVRVGVK